MPTSRRRFCLVTPAHLSNNPRLVKEADALAAAGHDVRVVSLHSDASAAARDATLVGERAWRHETVDVARTSARLRWAGWSVAQRAAIAAYDAGVRLGAARDLAASRFVVPLAIAAAREAADVFVAHNLEALPAAAWAARRHGARVAFDVEDLHEGIFPDTPRYARDRARVVAVQRRYLPQCGTLTAASPRIADEVAERYGVRRPVTILNAFPAAERPARPGPWRDRVSDEPALFWFSQTLGPDRGIEDAVDAMALMPDVPAHLYLRGAASHEYRAALMARAARAGVAGRVHLLDLVPPGELVARASEHDVGLALEQPDTLNRDICLTNKLFVYMLAGLAVAATATRGQRPIVEQHDIGGVLYPPGDAAALARGLRPLLTDRAVLADARARALRAALGPLSWERQARRLVTCLTSEAFGEEPIAGSVEALA